MKNKTHVLSFSFSSSPKIKRYRLVVFQSKAHLYAQVINPKNGFIVATASSVDASLRKWRGKKSHRSAPDKEMATKIGQLLKERLQSLGIGRQEIACHLRRYHGKRKYLVDQILKEE